MRIPQTPQYPSTADPTAPQEGQATAGSATAASTLALTVSAPTAVGSSWPHASQKRSPTTTAAPHAGQLTAATSAVALTPSYQRERTDSVGPVHQPPPPR